MEQRKESSMGIKHVLKEFSEKQLFPHIAGHGETAPCVQENIDKLLADSRFQQAMEYLKNDAANCLQELKEMVVISGAPFHEGERRAPMYRDKLAAYGAENCEIDAEGNVLGTVSGTGLRPEIIVEGHMDTVFSKDIPLKVTEGEDGWLFCPGIGDDTAALACNLSVLRAIRHAGLKPVGTLRFCGTVGEEGEGNARGIRCLMKSHPDVDAVISVESRGVEHVGLDAVGIRRYEVAFKGPGGHSWKDFGTPNPIHAMGRAIASISELAVPSNPRTSFSVGVVNGGTTINSLPQSAVMKIDMRSVDMVELSVLDVEVQSAVLTAVAAENKRWGVKEGGISAEKKVIGAIPAGRLPSDAPLAQLAMAATRAVGISAEWAPPSSTNQNIPVSMGIPAIVVGAGGRFRSCHKVEESYHPEKAWLAAQKLLILLFAAAGLDGVTDPIAQKITARGPVA